MYYVLWKNSDILFDCLIHIWSSLGEDFCAFFLLIKLVIVMVFVSGVESLLLRHFTHIHHRIKHSNLHKRDNQNKCEAMEQHAKVYIYIYCVVSSNGVNTLIN